MLKIVLFVFSCSIIFIAQGKCTISKPYIDNYEPSIFTTSNNLLNKVGLLNKAKGKEIILKGKILDKNCKIIPNAYIALWQVGFDGKYHYIPLREKFDAGLVHISYTDSFLGNGSTYSDNLGAFTFITVYPRAIQHLSAHVNIRVKHNVFGSLQTKIFLSKAQRLEDKGDIPVYYFDIVMPVENNLLH